MKITFFMIWTSLFAILKLAPDVMFDSKTTWLQHTNEKHSVEILASEIVAKITDIKCISIFYIHEIKKM